MRRSVLGLVAIGALVAALGSPAAASASPSSSCQFGAAVSVSATKSCQTPPITCLNEGGCEAAGVTLTQATLGLFTSKVVLGGCLASAHCGAGLGNPNACIATTPARFVEFGTSTTARCTTTASLAVSWNTRCSVVLAPALPG